MDGLTPAQKRAAQDMALRFPSEKIKCRTCIYKKSGIIGYKNAYCEIYDKGKPNEILFHDADCQWYVEESTA